MQAVVAGKASIAETELYVNVSERMRLLTQEYFDIRVRLNFAFTHLVCRHALEDGILYFLCFLKRNKNIK